jgi:hypothetical protein
MTPAEVAERFPQAVQTARIYREVFGEVRLIYAQNERSEVLKTREYQPPKS